MSRAILAASSSLLLFAAPCLAVGAPVGTAPSQIPVEAFISPDDIQHCELSPDGRHVAFAAVLGSGRVGLALMDLSTGTVEPLFVAQDNDVNFLFWKGSDRIVFGTEGSQDWDALRAISISSRAVVTLSESGPYGEWPLEHKVFVRLVDRLPLVPEKIFVKGFTSKRSRIMEFQLMDVRTGRLERMKGDNDPASTIQVTASTDGILRAKISSIRDSDVVEIRPEPDASFKKLAVLPWTEPTWRLLGISADNDTLHVVIESDTRRNSLHAVSLRTGERGEPLLVAADGAIKSIIQSTDLTTLLGVVIDGDKPRYHWFDAKRARMQEQIDVSLPGKWNEVTGISDDGAVALIRATSDVDPGSFYTLDRRESRMTFLGKARTKIDPALMSPMTPFRFTARDGLEIQGYITRPRGTEGLAAPLVVLPHKGPFEERDSWGFDGTRQFLASRGYAVLQVNFRGSSGFGKAFEKAGWHELGGKMQEDIADAVAWTIEQGIADPRRVAIMGFGFGGYSAMMGLINHPELYRCAVNYMGQMDLKVDLWFMRWSGGFQPKEYFETRFGTTSQILGSQSPVRLVERISAPSFHIYLYPDVKPEFRYVIKIKDETQLRMHERMQKAGKEFEEMVVVDEKLNDHWWDLQVEMHKRIEAFLAKHIPADE